jgi:dihydropteroate synthase-like protein
VPGRVLFLTGHLAKKRLGDVLAGLGDLGYPWAVQDIGIQVAALMTTEIIRRRLPTEARAASRIVVPGHCRGDLDALGAELGVVFERGPEDLHDLPAHLGQQAAPIDLSRHAVRIFAEIVEAPQLDVDGILARARRYARDGADVIDVGCLPATPFPHLEDAVVALKAEGFAVSVDSADRDELLRGGRAGADFVLSLSEATLDLARAFAATPVLVPSRPGDLDSLVRAADRMARQGRDFLVDSILDPIPFGFAQSLLRYAELRRRLPEARILMGIGNLTELTDADTTGINAVLFGIIAELGVTDVLAVEKSGHCRRAVREADRARRIMHAAHRLQRLPVGIDQSLMPLRDRRPFVTTAAEIADLAAEIRDRNFRIEVAADGIHVYNRDGHWVGTDAMELYPSLGVEQDGAHAFYLGVELARAQTAWQLGKRYAQDEDLDWKSAVDAPVRGAGRHAPAGPTLAARRKGRT